MKKLFLRKPILSRVARRGVFLALVLMIVLLPQVSSTSAAPSATYTLDWWTVDGGGVMGSSGGAYTLGGTAGQPDGNANAMSGGGFELKGGFWQVITAPENRLYLPGVLKE